MGDTTDFSLCLLSRHRLDQRHQVGQDLTTRYFDQPQSSFQVGEEYWECWQVTIYKKLVTNQLVLT